MKEYICVDNLKGLDQYAFGVEAVIADIPTVTDYEICLKFWNALIRLEKQGPPKSIWGRGFGEVIEEMEGR